MSWLCDICGYENEFNDESSSITCLCCGEPASAKKIIKARQELKAYHHEEKRKAYLEKHRRKQELWQKKIDGITKAIICVTKVISSTMTIMMALSIVLAGVLLCSINVTTENFLTVSENVKARQEAYVSNFLGNAKVTKSSLSNQTNYINAHIVVIGENAESDLKQIEENIPASIQNIERSLSNIKSNWHIFWICAKINVQEWITTITRR